MDITLPLIAETVELEEQRAPFLERWESFLRSFLGGDKDISVKPPAQEAAMPKIQAELPPEEGESLAHSAQVQGGGFLFSSGSKAGETITMPHNTMQREPIWQPNEVLNQVMENLSLLARPGGAQELRMKLYPEFLGEILVRMRNVRGVLSAEIMTQDIAVKEVLESQMSVLRQRFQQLDMQVGEFHITLNNEGNKGTGGGEARGQHGRGGAESPPVTELLYGKGKALLGSIYDEGYTVNYLV
jgi:flagellar hook-length control protein FliK